MRKPVDHDAPRLRTGRWAYAPVRAAIAVASLFALASCFVFRSTEDCSRNADCPRGTSCNQGGHYCERGAPIRVGVLLPLTGNQATPGQEREHGIRFGQWLLERPPNGPLLGRGLRLEVADTLSAANQVTRITRSVVDLNPAIVLGPVTSPDVIAAQAVTRPLRLLHIGPQSGADAVGASQPSGLSSRYLFQLIGKSARAAGTTALFMASKQRPKNYDACFDGVAIVWRNDATGDAQRNAHETLLPNNCIPVSATIDVPAEKKSDYVAEVDAIIDARTKGKKTRCVLLLTRSDVGGELMRVLKRREVERSVPIAERVTAFLGGPSLNVPSFPEDARSGEASGATLAEGVYGYDSDARPDRPQVRDLEALFAEYATETNLPPEVVFHELTIIWAEAVIVAGLTLELAGSTEPTSLRDSFLDLLQPADGDVEIGPREISSALARIRALRQTGAKPAFDYRGAMGDFDLDEDGYVRTGGLVWRVKDGGVERVFGVDGASLDKAFVDPGPACAAKP